MIDIMISHNEDEKIIEPHTDLTKEQVKHFFKNKISYLYSVAEYDEDNEIIERLNGLEWMSIN